jgi:uncharacterized protein
MQYCGFNSPSPPLPFTPSPLLFQVSRIIHIFTEYQIVQINSKVMNMSVSTLIIIIVIGIITGVVAGMLGIGGAIIMIPALVFFLGFSQQMAQGTSLAVMLPPVGILATYNYWKAGHVDMKVALILAATFIIGSYFGSKFALTIPQVTLKKIFGILLLLVAARMLFWK